MKWDITKWRMNAFVDLRHNLGAIRDHESF